ncbi:hypothetical protein ACFL5Q_02535 [Planctomycetota bacterium]
MGFNVATIAIRGKPLSEIHAQVGVQPTGESDEEPDAPVVGAMLPSGWYLIYFNDRDFPDSHGLSQLSLGAELVLNNVSETVMYSHASGWENGNERWSVTHDAQQGLDHLERTGDVPPSLSAITQRLETLQREKDDADYIFDIPVELVRDITGFRYDGNNGGYPVDEFSTLQRLAPKKKWWQFWK